jgi:predicted RND superfamily exporter protein
MSRLFASWLIRYRAWVLAGALAFTAFMASPLIPLNGVRFDFSFRKLFRFEGPEMELLARFKDSFGDDGGAFGVLYVTPGTNPHRAAALSPDLVASMARIDAWVEGRVELDQEYSLSPPTATDFYGEPLTTGALGGMTAVLALAGADPGVVAESWDAEQLDPGLAEYAAIAARLMDHELYRGMLLSEDGTAAAAHYRFTLDYLHPSSRRGFLAEFDSLVEAEQKRVGERARLHVFGLPVVTEEYTRLSIQDIVKTAPLSTGVMAVLLLLFLRSIVGVAMPLLVVSLAVVWSIGLMQMTDEPINIINHIVPVMVLVLGLSDSVHLVLRFLEERRRGLSNEAAAQETARAMSRACFLTNFTNGIGFASLATATIATVASFGIYTGIACMMTFLADIALLPVVLSYYGPSPRPGGGGRWLEDLLERFARFQIRQKWVLFAGGVALNIGGVLAGIFLMGVDSHLLEEVPPENRVHQATKTVEARLTPVIPHEVLIEGKVLPGVSCDTDADCTTEGYVCRRTDRVRAALAPYRDASLKLGLEEGGAWLSPLEEQLEAGVRGERGTCVASVKSPALLKALDAVGKALLEDPGVNRHVRRVESLASLVRQMHKAMRKGDPAADVVPESPAAVSQVLLPLESGAPELIERYATPDYTTTRQSLYLLDHGSSAWDGVRPVLEKELETHIDQDPELSARFSHAITGTMTYVQQALSFIISDLLSSVITAFIPIFLIIGLLFRSARIGILSILPNTFPLALTLAFMAFSGINLRVSTLIIFSVSLGIAVNDTIHFIARYTEELQRGLERENALVEAMKHVGPGMLISTSILVIGFLVNLVSEFVALQQFGLLASYTMAMALVGDLFLVIPCVLILGGKPKTAVPPGGGTANAG